MSLFTRNNSIFSKFRQYVTQANQIVIIPHENPDGDAIGSALALWHLLKSINKKAQVISPNNFPAFLKWMPGANGITMASRNKHKAMREIANADLIICVDFNDLTRMSVLAPVLSETTAPVVIIDHHPNPKANSKLLIHSINASSTAEIVFETIEKSDFGSEVNLSMAECLYAGIMTDTGSFNYNSSNANTFRVVSKLLKTGIDKDAIYDRVYNNFSSHRMRLLGYALNEKMTVLDDCKTAYISLSLSDLAKYNYVTGDTEGFVNYPLSVSGVRVSAIFIERENHIKISFRSKGSFPVNSFASKHFFGGGHRNAAGGEFHGTLQEALGHFENLLKNYKDEIV